MNQFKHIAEAEFVKALQKQGGEVFLVGGIVRDSFLNIKSKDIDLVVRNLTIDEISETINKFGESIKTTVAGKMGVVKFTPTNSMLGTELPDEPIDIALPRTERLMTVAEQLQNKVTNMHNAFVVNSNPMLPIEKDLERRDFTINSMAINLADMELVDPFDGMEDIEKKLIRHTNNEAFNDDPLRMFRAVQFGSRFEGFEIAADTFHMIVDNVSKANTVAAERIHAELLKIFNKGDIQKGIRIMRDTGLHAELFQKRPSASVTTINTKEDFFFHVCNSPESFKKVFKGDTKTHDGIKAIIQANNVMVSAPVNEDGTWNMTQIRLALFDAVKVSQSVLNSGKLIGPLLEAQKELVSAKFPISMKELDIDGKDLQNAGMKPGPGMGKALRTALEFVMDEGINKKEVLLKHVL